MSVQQICRALSGLGIPTYKCIVASAIAQVISTSEVKAINMLQVVLAGCEGQVLMYSISVDDTDQTAQTALATALEALSLQEALPGLDCPEAAQVDVTADAQPFALAPSIQQLSNPDWNQALQLQLLCQVSKLIILWMYSLLMSSCPRLTSNLPSLVHCC